jgi:tRNA pseudouridine38-40 synthase
MRNIKLTIEYDGKNYLGWQVQPKGPSIQETIEGQLKRLTGETIRLISSGRTDAGVHAMGQVAHFKTENPMDCPTLQRALNSLLPADILIVKAEEADPDFHARKECKSKVYEYRILNRSLRSVFHREHAWHIPQPLDLEGMRRATRYLVGEHDFSSFRSVGTPTRTAIRKIIRAEWKRNREGLLTFEIEATGFLKQMVRAIVGTLVEVGRNKISADEVGAILESRDRTKAGPTAPARGLFLKEVKYESAH